MGNGARGIRFESSLERDFIALKAYDPAVREIEEQPVRIQFGSGGRPHHYVPDFRVTYVAAGRPTELVEIKYQAELIDREHELKARFDAAKEFAGSRGWQFIVMTEQEIRTPHLENLRFLQTFRHEKPESGVSARLINEVNRARSITIDGLLGRTFNADDDRGRGLRCIWCLVANGLLSVDLSVALTTDCELELGPRVKEGALRWST